VRSPGEAPPGPVALSPAGAQAVALGAAWVEAESTAAADQVMVISTPFFLGPEYRRFSPSVSRNCQIVMLWVVAFHRHEQRRTFDLRFSAFRLPR
jgi:hypothetical protein